MVPMPPLAVDGVPLVAAMVAVVADGEAAVCSQGVWLVLQVSAGCLFCVMSHYLAGDLLLLVVAALWYCSSLAGHQS